jgi:hypothetical protein
LPFKNVTRSFTRPPKNVTRTATAAQRTVIRNRPYVTEHHRFGFYDRVLVLIFYVLSSVHILFFDVVTSVHILKVVLATPLLPTRERSSEKNLTQAEKSDMLSTAYQSDTGAKKTPPNNVRQGQT